MWCISLYSDSKNHFYKIRMVLGGPGFLPAVLIDAQHILAPQAAAGARQAAQ
jgi:hypothetical protein